MRKYILAALLCLSVGRAQTVLLDSFGAGSASGGVLAGTSWIGQVFQDATRLLIGGTAKDENGWGARNVSLDTTGMNFLTITGQRDAGNQAPTLFFQFEDQFLRTRVLSVSTTSFAIGTPTVLNIPLPSWADDFDANAITSWSLGGGSVGTVPFRMTLDEVSFSASAIPEPSTYALLAGLLTLGAVAYRRRRPGP